MKVIHIMDNLGVTGGVNSFVYDLCYALKKQDIDVSLIGIIDSDDKNNVEVKKLRQLGMEVICLGAQDKKDAILHYGVKLRKKIVEISNGTPTICNLHLKLSVLLGGLSTIGLGNIKCVETYHSQYSRYIFEYNLMKHRISLYIPCSESAGKEMHQRFQVPIDRMNVISNGIVCDEIQSAKAIKDVKITFLSVGRLTEQKNYPVIIEAFNQLDMKNIVYKIIGKGEEEKNLKKQASTECICFLGTMEREKVLSYTSGADMVCMPSLWEGLSIYMMEAFALGKPMLLSDIPSFRDAVGESELINEKYRKCDWGYLVKVDDPKAYCEAILDFIQNSNEWEGMRKASSAISKKFDIDFTAEKYIKAYQNLCDS